MPTIIAHSGEATSLVLNNAPGSLNAILHAVLVTGWDATTLTSLVVANGVATATLAGHPYSDQVVVEISGATPSALNGQHVITRTGSGAFTFPATAANGTAGGVISCKRAAAGWVRSHHSGSVSIYSRSDPLATTMSLRVDDDESTPGYARVLMVWGVSDIHTWANQAPATGHFWWPKGAATTAAKRWVVIADERTMYLMLDGTASWPASSYQGIPMGVWGFGDFEGDAPSGAFDCFLSAASAADSSVSSETRMMISAPLGNQPSGMLVARSFTGLGAPVICGPTSSVNGGTMGGSGPPFPSPVDNGVRLQSPLLLAERNSMFSHPIRGALRGVAVPLAGMPVDQVHLQRIPVAGSNRRWMLVGYRTQSSYGTLAFDLDGPW